MKEDVGTYPYKMRNIMANIYDSFDTLSDIQLAEFEKTIGYKLPKDYYQFLQQHNGGYPTPGDFEYQDPDRGTRTDMIRKFFGVVDRDDWVKCAPVSGQER